MKTFALLLCLALPILAQDEPAPGGRRGGASDDPINAGTFSSLRVRNIGPAFISGRVSQIAVFPDDSNHYLIAEASGGIWVTNNNGTTWTPVFDTYGSYSIGCDHHRPQESFDRLGRAPARTTTSAASPMATASTRAKTADAPGATSASS